MKIIIFLFILLCPALLHADTTTGLIGWWKFNEGSGTSAYDSSSQGSTGTLQNSPTWTDSCARKNCLTFNGSNYVTMNVSTLSNATNEFTISLWISSAGSSAGEHWAFYSGNSGQASWSMFIAQNGAQWLFKTLYNSGESNFSSASFAINTWTHLAITYNGTTLTAYLNGASLGSATPTAPRLRPGPYVSFGATDLGESAFAGSIDDARIYNRALTAQDIYMLYLSDNKIVGTSILNNAQFK